MKQLVGDDAERQLMVQIDGAGGRQCLSTTFECMSTTSRSMYMVWRLATSDLWF